MSYQSGEGIVRIISAQETSLEFTLVTTQTTGTESARATDRCSLLIPINPAFAPTMSNTKSGEVAVNPNNVVLRYLCSRNVRSAHFS